MKTSFKIPRLALSGLCLMPVMQQFATADIFTTNLDGFMQVGPADNLINGGANRIVAAGGITNPLVEILAGTVFTADGPTPGITVDTDDYFSASATGLFGPPAGNNIPPLLAPGDIVIPSTGVILNDGSITGGTHGLDGLNNRFLLINSGVLSGAQAGIVQIGGGSFIVNSGTISGGSSSAIHGITNGADDVIVHNTGILNGGANFGVLLDDNSLVINSNMITGASAGVSLGGGSSLYNLEGGVITGTIGYRYATQNQSAGDFIMLFNWGEITGTGGTAVLGSGGSDSFFFNPGSIINGNINAGAGADLVFVEASPSGNVEINGNIDGGAGADDISLFADRGGIFLNGSIIANPALLSAAPDMVDLTSINGGNIILTGGISSGSGSDVIRLLSDIGGIIDINGNLSGGLGADIIELRAFDSGTIRVGGDVQGGLGDDFIGLWSFDSGVIQIDGDIEGGLGNDFVDINVGNFGGVRVLGDVAGGLGNDWINLFADSSGFIEILGDIEGGLGQDVMHLQAFGGGVILVNGDIDGGLGSDQFWLYADGGEIIVEGSLIANPLLNILAADDAIDLTAINGGTITIDGAIVTGSGDDFLSILSQEGGLVRIMGGIDMGLGDDILTLDTSNDWGAPGSIIVAGGITGGGANQVLNLAGGLMMAPVFTGGSDFEDFTEAMRGTGMNLILGDVNTIQDLFKTGEGVAMISGYDVGAGMFDANASHEIDRIQVDGGGLYISGDLAATPSVPGGLAEIVVGPGGAELGGTGNWNANVLLEAGSISAGGIPMNLDWSLGGTSGPIISSIGELAITGSLRLESGAFIRHDLRPQLDAGMIAAGNGSDLIRHTSAGSGFVSFDPGSRVVLSPSDINRVVSDGRYVVVSSDSQIEGMPGGIAVQFNANVGDEGPYRGTLVPALKGSGTQVVSGTMLERFSTLGIVANGAGEDLVIDVLHDYAGVGATLGNNEAGMGAALDASVTSSNPLLQDFIASLDYSDLGTAQRTLSAMVPTDVLGISTSIVSSNFRMNRMIQNRLAGLRDTSSGMATTMVPMSKGSKTPASPACFQDPNLWGALSYDWQDSKNIKGEVAYFSVGADVRVAPNVIMGIMLEGSTADANFTGGSTDIESIRTAVYATYGSSSGFYADFLLGYGRHDIDIRRTLGGLLGGQYATSKTNGDSFQAMLMAGYTIDSASIKHGPFAGFEYQTLDVDAYTQKSPLPIDVSATTVNSSRGIIGYRAQARFDRFVPFGSLAYAHEFENGNLSTRASLPGGAVFPLTGASIGSAVLVGLGSGYDISESMRCQVGYFGEISTESGIDSHGASVSFNFSF